MVNGYIKINANKKYFILLIRARVDNLFNRAIEKRMIKIKSCTEKETFPRINKRNKPKNNTNELIIYIVILAHYPYYYRNENYHD